MPKRHTAPQTESNQAWFKTQAKKTLQPALAVTTKKLQVPCFDYSSLEMPIVAKGR